MNDGRRVRQHGSGYHDGMSFKAALWRVLLCISVIFNGSALASTSMPMSPSVHHQPADRTTVGTDGPSLHSACHEQAAVVVAANAHTPSGPTMPGKGKHATPDCCAAGSCACACMSPLSSVAIARFDPLAMHAMRSGQARLDHDEPVLHHLIRPPIG